MAAPGVHLYDGETKAVPLSGFGYSIINVTDAAKSTQ